MTFIRYSDGQVDNLLFVCTTIVDICIKVFGHKGVYIRPTSYLLQNRYIANQQNVSSRINAKLFKFYMSLGGDTCQMWTWFTRSGTYIRKTRNGTDGEINGQNCHPGSFPRSSKTSYRQNPRSLEASSYGFGIVGSLWNVTGVYELVKYTDVSLRCVSPFSNSCIQCPKLSVHNPMAFRLCIIMIYLDQ